MKEKHFLNGRRCLVLDLDGVVYEGSKAVTGAIDAIAAFHKAGWTVQYLTNSSIRSASQTASKLALLGIECSAKDVMTSATAAAYHLRCVLGHGARVFVVGSPCLVGELERFGLANAKDPTSCDAVLVGMDVEFTYAKLTQSLTALRTGALFIACNRDPSYPAGEGVLLPGCGPIVAAVEVAAARQVDIEIGKPNRLILDILLKQSGLSLSDCILVGDSLHSDIALANRVGIPGVWIHRGQPITEKYDTWTPNIVVENLAQLAAHVL